MNKEEIIDNLKKLRPEIINSLQNVVNKRDFEYRTFGTSVENYLFDIIISLLKSKKLISSDSQYKRAKDKNEFPDLTIRTNPPLALEAKAGNRSRFVNGVWKPCKNSANDLGTLNTFEEKLKKFNGNDIFYIFIEYNFTDKEKKIVDVKIDNFYKFVGLNKAGLLSYREKDGNLRPKDFDKPPLVNSMEQFVKLFPMTKKYRSSRIAQKHLQGLSKKELSELFDKLNGSV